MELLDDYFNLALEECEAAHLSHERSLLKRNIIFTIYYLSLFNFYGGIVTVLIFLIIYFVKKAKNKRIKNLSKISENDKKE